MKRNHIYFIPTILLFTFSLFNCQAVSVPEVIEKDIILSKALMPEKSGMTVKGVVIDENENPIEGVVVNDGKNFTVTDASGFYYLPSDLTKNKFVSISIPANYEIEDEVVSSFYKKLTNKANVNRRDFRLNKRKELSDAFAYLALSDPQVRNMSHMNRLEIETFPDLKETIRQQGEKETFVMTLGDNVFDVMELFTLYKYQFNTLKTPVFSTIGNHDFDLRYKDLYNAENPLANYAEEIYESHFGPVDYSFNAGNVHIITMKNIDKYINKTYTEQFTPDQLEWLKKDLSYVSKDKVVFLNIHAPTSNKTSNGSGNTRNTAQLLEVLKGYNVHIFAGHTHFFENQEPAPGIYEHNIGAVCGAWWAGQVNRCGAPNGYLVVNVKGNDVKWQYKATGKDLNYQFRTYKPGEFATQADYVVANVWDWDQTYKVKWYEDGVLKGEMENFSDEDQDFITMKNGKGTGYKTNHLFRFKPSATVKLATIEVTNRFGDIYTQTLDF